MGIRRYRDVPRVYFDMDGPLADFERAMIKTGLPPDELKNLKGLYEGLRVTPLAKEAVSAIMQMPVDCWVMTKTPSSSPYAASEKQKWLRQHFPEFKDYVVMTPDKGAVGAERDFLIDDHPEWANADKFRGTLFRFTAVYNQESGSSSNNWMEIVAELEKRLTDS